MTSNQRERRPASEPTGRTSGSAQGLEGVRVLEFPDPKTALCGKLLAEMGADVVLVEPPGGSPTRSLPPLVEGYNEGLFFWYTNAHKRSVTLDVSGAPGRETFLKLVKGADVVLDPFQPGYLASQGLDDKALFDANPRLVLLSLTAFGLSGPFKDYLTSDIVAWAMSGLMSLTGDPGREPLTAPALQGYQAGSLWATISVQAAIYRRLRTGQGARLDLSLQEALFDSSETCHSLYLCNKDIVMRMSGDHTLACPFKVFKVKDGYCFIGLGSQQQWQGLLEWMDRFGIDVPLLRDPAMLSAPERGKRRKEVNQAVGEFATHMSKQVLFLEGAQKGIPNGPVRAVREVLDDDQLQSRDFFAAVQDPRTEKAGAEYPTPSLPFRSRSGGGRLLKMRPAPASGQHTAEVLREWALPGRQWPAAKEPARLYPLEGVKVVDLCWNIAGPTLGRILTDLGATTVKVEPREVGAPERMLVPFPGNKAGYERSFTFNDLNRNKMSVSLNMKNPAAPPLALRLAQWADVFVENFTSGTLDRLNIPYDRLSSANPRLVLGSITGYGQDGPRKSFPSYHPTSAALSGLIHLFTYEGGEPLGFGNSYMDYVAGYFGAIGVLDGLLRREATGKGDHMDISQLESAVNMVGTELMDWTVNQREARGQGNRAGALGALLQGCYRCRGDDRWIVVSVPDQKALANLAQVLGKPPKTPAKELEAALGAWALRLDPWEAFQKLQQGGVAAGVVSTGKDLAENDEHLRARGIVGRLPHPEIGQVAIAECPLVVDGKRLVARRAAPLLGQHNEQVLRQNLGLDEAAFLDLVVGEVI